MVISLVEWTSYTLISIMREISENKPFVLQKLGKQAPDTSKVVCKEELPVPFSCLIYRTLVSGLYSIWQKTGEFLPEDTAAAKSLQLCLTLCDPLDGSPPRLPRPWGSPGKNTGVGCHFPLQCMKVKSQSEVAQSYRTLSDPMDCSLPSSSVHGIFQARVLEWGAIIFSNQPNRKKMVYCDICRTPV